MKKYFWLGFIGLLLFEICNVYFIMPMPGSQRMNSIGFAYFLYRWRWVFRILFGAMMFIGLLKGNWSRKWVPIVPLTLLFTVMYMSNFKMAADAMFRQPKRLLMAGAADNKIDSNRLVIGVFINNEAKAYPIQLLGYHHHIQDSVGGKAVLVTYCTVCRTGRVFEPIVNGRHEKFRLVGMDHFNAMLEDVTTKSWWRQATGEAITGKRKGQKLPEVFSTQTSLKEWLALHPESRIMQADPDFEKMYTPNMNYEEGKTRDMLTGTDTTSWNDKSWVVGVKTPNGAKAYDWNRLMKERVIQDNIDNTPILLVLAADNKSFFAFEHSDTIKAELRNDTLISGSRHFRIDGKGIDTAGSLKPLMAYQEFWHSWRTFNPPPTKK